MPTQKVADLVERLENIMKAFFGVKHMNDVEVEKYHQDAPLVTASWTWQEDPLSRNIGMLVNESNNECFVDFQANIWLDDTTNLKRNWLYKYCGTIWVEPYTGEKLPVAMGITLEKIFNDILKIKTEELTNISDLCPPPQ